MADYATKLKGLWDYYMNSPESDSKYSLWDFLESWDMDNRPWQGRAKYYDEKQQDITYGDYDKIYKWLKEMELWDRSERMSESHMPTSGRKNTGLFEGDSVVDQRPVYQAPMPFTGRERPLESYKPEYSDKVDPKMFNNLLEMHPFFAPKFNERIYPSSEYDRLRGIKRWYNPFGINWYNEA